MVTHDNDEGFVPIEERPSARRPSSSNARGRSRSAENPAGGSSRHRAPSSGETSSRGASSYDRTSYDRRAYDETPYDVNGGHSSRDPSPRGDSRRPSSRPAPSAGSPVVEGLRAAGAAAAGVARKASAGLAGLVRRIADALSGMSVDRALLVRVAIGVAALALVVFIVASIARCASGGGSDVSGGDTAAALGDGGAQSGADAPADQASTLGTVDEGSGQPAAQHVDPVTIETLMVGDILVHRGVWESGEQADGTRNYDHLFAHVGDQLAAADLKIVDQETVLGGDAFEISGYPMFNSPQEIGDAEVRAGFNCILRASNHSMDMWDDGLTSELTFWRTKHPEMLVVGAVMPGVETASEAGPVYFEKDGFKVAILNYTEDLNGMPDYSDAVCELDTTQLQRDVAIAEQNADLTIVCPHWGYEGSYTPNEYQLTFAQIMCDLGVDVVFGNHPHVMQPVTVITSTDGTHRMGCFWSVGNFVSTMADPENMVAGIAKATLVKDENGARVESIGLTPIVTHRGYDELMTTFKLEDYTDDLAATNYWYGGEELPYPDWCNQLCSDILGSAYDPVAHDLRIDVDPAPTAAAAVPGGDASSSGQVPADGSAAAPADSPAPVEGYAVAA